MRKIPPALENPLDDMFISVADAMAPTLKKLGHTPNVITTYSALSAIMSLVALNAGNVGAFAALWMMHVLFDCTDGHFARAYGMQSRFGDVYDHVTDFGSLVGLAYVVHKRYDMAKVHPAFWVAGAVFFVMTIIQLGCQQRYARIKAETLSVFRPTCPDVGWMHFTRWFSHGSVHVFMILSIAYFERHYRRTPPAAV